MLPEGWHQSTVGRACAIKNNLRFPLSKEHRGTMVGQYPYFGPTGILGYLDHFRIDEEFALIGEDGDHFLKFRDRPMTLLFSGPANVNNHAHIIGNSSQCSAKWFHYWFMHRDLTSILSRQGVGRYKLTKAGLERLEIWLPPKSEQAQIAKVLGTWDDAITTTAKLLANSRKQRLALTNSLLSGRRRLASSAKWSKHRLSDLIIESRIPGTTGDVAKKITVKLYGRGVVAKNEKRLGSDSTQYFRRRAGQFIYSKLDFLNGAFGLMPPELDGYESTLDLPAFDFQAGVDPRWFLYFVSREDFYLEQLGLANGGRKARRVNPSDLLRLVIDAPTFAEQSHIADVIDTAVADENDWEQSLALLQRQKRALLCQLLTGKRRVTSADSVAEAVP